MEPAFVMTGHDTHALNDMMATLLLQRFILSLGYHPPQGNLLPGSPLMTILRDGLYLSFLFMESTLVSASKSKSVDA